MRKMLIKYKIREIKIMNPIVSSDTYDIHILKKIKSTFQRFKIQCVPFDLDSGMRLL